MPCGGPSSTVANYKALMSAQAPDGEVLLNAAEANASSGEDSTAGSQALAPDQDASNSDGANPEDVSNPSKQNAGAD